ncbi:unnamed protein product [Trichogramma brassicae]|uniref:C2H2-type domain-containing protein n=1 Tax=Trichogramma brassicae TaxID=86971 RepID=A0A6H5J5Q1_9HYME|nr:unnamed protein product [Trichogramma brassicae]
MAVFIAVTYIQGTRNFSDRHHCPVAFERDPAEETPPPIVKVYVLNDPEHRTEYFMCSNTGGFAWILSHIIYFLARKFIQNVNRINSFEIHIVRITVIQETMSFLRRWRRQRNTHKPAADARPRRRAAALFSTRARGRTYRVYIQSICECDFFLCTFVMIPRCPSPCEPRGAMFNIGRKDYACDKCEKKFERKSRMLFHQKTVHEGRRDYACDRCEKKFTQKVHLLVHHRTVHEARKDYPCDKCDKKFGKKSHLLRHHKIVHENRKDHACDKCEKKLATKQNLRLHQQMVHEGRKDYVCDKCDKVFAKKSNLLVHQKIAHEGRKDYECDKCEKKLTTKQNLHLHQKTVHDGHKDYGCDICEKKFGQRVNLLLHQKIFHEGRKDYACDKCEKKFGQKGTLRTHQKTVHENRKDFACYKCEKKFERKSCLLLHQKTVHEGRKDFTCDKCDKKFGYKSTLLSHMKTVHEGRKDYACDKCKKNFGQKQYLLLHQKTVHEGRKDFACDKCDLHKNQVYSNTKRQSTKSQIEGSNVYFYHHDGENSNSTDFFEPEFIAKCSGVQPFSSRASTRNGQCFSSPISKNSSTKSSSKFSRLQTMCSGVVSLALAKLESAPLLSSDSTASSLSSVRAKCNGVLPDSS